MSHTESEASCVVCQHDADRPVCDRCRVRVHRQLSELPILLSEATELTIADHPPLYRYVGAELGCAQRIQQRDPVELGLPSGPTGSPGRVRVTGSRTAPLPISVDLLSLVGPGALRVSGNVDDQLGELPPRVWLMVVVADWAELRGEPRSPITFADHVRWLLARLDWALDHHPAPEDFAEELRIQHSVLFAAAGRIKPKAELCQGVACGHCQTRALWRIVGDVECGNCGAIYRGDEYADLTREQARSVAA